MNKFSQVFTVAFCMINFIYAQQWEKTNGPEGSSIHAFILKDDTIFTGTNRGVFISSNSGASWTESNTGLTDLYIQAFAVAGDNIFVSTNFGGVFLSANNGESWTSSNSGITHNVLSFAVDGDNIFAGTNSGGVFLSTYIEG